MTNESLGINYSCEDGFIAIKHSDSSTASAAFAWVSDTFYDLRIFELAEVSSLDVPPLYRREETQQAKESTSFLDMFWERTHCNFRELENNAPHRLLLGVSILS